LPRWKGKPKHDFVLDSLTSREREKDQHEWQKPEGEVSYLLEKLTSPGDLEVDPFCGSGTTLLDAKEPWTELFGG